MGRVDSTIERSLPVFSEWSQPDVLSRLGAFRVPVVASASLGGSDTGPARCPVHGAGVARGLDEGLDEHRRGVVALGPVLGQAPAHDGEDVRAEAARLQPVPVRAALPRTEARTVPVRRGVPAPGRRVAQGRDHRHRARVGRRPGRGQGDQGEPRPGSETGAEAARAPPRRRRAGMAQDRPFRSLRRPPAALRRGAAGPGARHP